MNAQAHKHIYEQHPTWPTHLSCTICGFAIVKNPRIVTAEVLRVPVGYKSPEHYLATLESNLKIIDGNPKYAYLKQQYEADIAKAKAAVAKQGLPA